MERAEFESKSLEHMEALYRMAMQLTRHPDSASDLVQETYLRALRFSERYEEQGGGIRPWLFKILHNVFYSKYGRSKREPTLVEDFPSAQSGKRCPMRRPRSGR